VGSKAFGGLNRRLKEKTAESRWFETTGQAPFGRAKAAYWKIKREESLKRHAWWRYRAWSRLTSGVLLSVIGAVHYGTSKVF
jgi:hypothetical protein